MGELRRSLHRFALDFRLVVDALRGLAVFDYVGFDQIFLLQT